MPAVASHASWARPLAARAMKQIDGSETGQEADQHCKQDEPPIVLDREAVEYPEHGVLAC